MPRRFEEYLIASGKETLRDRDLLLAEVRGIATDGGAANWLERIGRWSERRRLERYIAEIEAGASSQQGEFARLQRSHKLASTAIEVRSRELATAHFMRAELHAKAAADRQVLAGDASEALASFREATRLDKSDWRIHRAYVEQMGKTNQLNDDVLSAVEGWREAANQSGNRREEAMALFRFGEVHFQRSSDPSLHRQTAKDRRDEAIIALEKAIGLMQDNPPIGVAPGHDLSLAGCLELLGDVRVRSVTMTIARQKLMAAREIYSAVDDAEAVGRVDIKLKRMNSEDSDSESSASQ